MDAREKKNPKKTSAYQPSVFLYSAYLDAEYAT